MRGDAFGGAELLLAPLCCVLSVFDVLRSENAAVVGAHGAVLLVLSLCLSLVRVAVVLFVSG